MVVFFLLRSYSPVSDSWRKESITRYLYSPIPQVNDLIWFYEDCWINWRYKTSSKFCQSIALLLLKCSISSNLIKVLIISWLFELLIIFRYRGTAKKIKNENNTRWWSWQLMLQRFYLLSSELQVLLTHSNRHDLLAPFSKVELGKTSLWCILWLYFCYFDID